MKWATNIGFFCAVLSVTFASEPAQSNPRIAIIGTGIGGTSCAHYLRELFGPAALIDAYEKDQIGGRLQTIQIAGREYESGATIIHPRNAYMVNFTEMLGLRPKDPVQGRLGLFDGNQFALDGSSWTALFIAQMMWRYGLDPYRLGSLVEQFLSEFDNIYKHQEDGFAFTTSNNLLSSMSPRFVDQLLTKSTAQDLLDNGFSKPFIEELVRGGLMVNYGQDVNMHAFVGSVSLAGIQPGLWSVYGGNKQIPQKLLQTAKVNVLNSKVTKVTLTQEKKFKLETESKPGTVYDIVIVATPLHEELSDIEFEQFPKPIRNFPNRFEHIVANFIEGRINLTKFEFSSEKDFPKALLVTDPNLFYNSISKQYPVDYKLTEADEFEKQTRVWKVFSEKPLTEHELDNLFPSRESVGHAQHFAYPHYSSSVDNIPPFQLHQNLYYVNGIEWAASALEVSVIGGRNVALLAFHNWHGTAEKIDQSFQKSTTNKSEL